MAFLQQNLLEMIKKIFVYFVRLFLINSFFIFVFKKKYKLTKYKFDFQNIIFEDMEYLKKILFSEKYFNKKILDEKSVFYHSFDWLNAAKIVGGARSISYAKKQILNWHQNRYSKNSFAWNINNTSKRLTNLIYNYDFYASSSSKKEEFFFHNIILEHFFALYIEYKLVNLQNLPINVTKILLLFNLIHKQKIEKILKSVSQQIYNNVDGNGFHKSNNPSHQAEFINQLHEIKNICLFFNINAPKEIEFQIYNMTSLLSSLFHKDNSIALFNGSNNANYTKLIKIVAMIKDIKSKELKNISNGINIYDDDNKKIFFDVIKPSSKQIAQNMHAGTLSFEMSCDKEKIITNCGSIEKRFGEKPEYLRFTAAHSTIILNNTNISELIKKKSYKRIPENILFNFEEDEHKLIWNASHDGYKNNFGKIVKRKLMISKEQNEIHGEDSIINIRKKQKRILYNIRFHLTPKCSCLLTNNHKSVLIKTKKNKSWIFRSNSNLSIENSIYIENGKKIEQTKQIVITNYTNNSKKIENWSLSKYKLN
tara:strand:+ start:338 stop:1948 length:1611 start_codon:yes stop_codon:yes gene_type:complete